MAAAASPADDAGSLESFSPRIWSMLNEDTALVLVGAGCKPRDVGASPSISSGAAS